MSRLARRISVGGEGGFTLVEVMIAAFVLLTAGFGALQVLITSTKVNYRAEQADIAIERAQAELEAIRALPYEQIAMVGPPQMSSDPADPRSRVSFDCDARGISFNGCFALARDGTDRAPLVVNGGARQDAEPISGGEVNPGGPESTLPSDSFTTGDVSGTIHRFVVWKNDPGCRSEFCPGPQDYKRVVIAVELDDAAAGQRTYREVQSDFTDPEAGRNSAPTPEVTEETIAQQFYLSDTTCDQTERVAPSDHRAHNTHGTCADGLSTSLFSDGAPDLLTTLPPPLLPNGDTPDQYDYSTNSLLDSNLDRGLQLPPLKILSCNFTLLGREARHRWVSEPIPTETGSGSGFVIDGDATLKLSTRTTILPGGLQVPLGATLCVKLFIHDDATGTNTPLVNGTNYFRYRKSIWPTSWDEISVSMDIQGPDGSEAIIVPPGKRLGMEVALAELDLRDLNPLAANPLVSIMYDHPEFKSRLEVETSTPFEGAF